MSDTQEIQDTQRIESFEEMNLKTELLKGIFGFGFENVDYLADANEEVLVPSIN